MMAKEDSLELLTAQALPEERAHGGKRWRNPYIDRLQTLPGYILAAKTELPSDAEKDLLQARSEAFPQLYLELGSGSGRHLITRAQKQPDALFVGFELRYKRVFRTAEKAADLGLGNLLVIKTSAARTAALFGGASVDGVYVNFPDPWDKKRWGKHRMLNSKLLEELAIVLKVNGFISYKTDQKERFLEVVSLIERSGHYRITTLTEDLHHSAYSESNITTEFESLFLSQQMPICLLEARLS